MTGQEMNNRQTYKIFFFSLNTGHAETVIQVLESEGHSDMLFTAYVIQRCLPHTEMTLLKHYGS